MSAQTLGSCLACAAALSAAEESCLSCGAARVAASRRVVTVVFADLVGYTRLSSDLDVEQVHEIVRPLMNALRQVCLSLGGLVPSIEGDGFMAVFGALRAREDDPARALLAASRMQALAHGRKHVHGSAAPNLRVGVNSGEVLVSPSWEAAGFSLVGDPVNVGSRLCHLADEGSVLAASATLELAPEIGAGGQPRLVHVRNRDVPVEAVDLHWRELVASPRPDLEWSTPFVGRATVLEGLGATTASGLAVQLVGEPGVGKTRLAAEWAGRRTAPLLRVRFASFPDSDESPLSVLLDGLPEEWLTTATTSPLARRRLRRLRGLPVDAFEDDSRADQLDSLCDLLVEVAREHPLTVLFDDAHAAVGEERACLSRLVAELAASGAAVIVTARALVELPAQMVVLSPLEGTDLDSLVRELIPDADEELCRLVERRTGGNPLFVEQCARLLREQHGAGVGSPVERLQAVPTLMRLFVASRFDLLGSEQKRVLQAAAVLGESFELDLLRHLSGTGHAIDGLVDSLVVRGMLRWEAHPQEAPVLQFCHQLVRDVAYQEITKQQRVAVHRAAAEWYGTFPVVQNLAAEARHLEAALSLGDADCDLVRRTVEVLVFWSRSVLEERPLVAREALDRAARLVSGHPQCDVDDLGLLMARAHLDEQGGDFTAAAGGAAEVQRRAAEAGLELEAAVAALLHGRALVMTEPQAAFAVLDEAASAFAALGDDSGLARVEVERARARAHEGLQPRIDAYTSAHGVALRSGDSRLASLASQDLALHTLVTDPPVAQLWAETARGLLRRDDAVGLARLGLAEVLSALLRADFVGAAELANAATQAAWAAGAVQTAMMGQLYEIEARSLAGDLDGAARVLSLARKVAVTRVTEHLSLDLDLHEALLAGRRGDVDTSLSTLEAARERCLAHNIDFERQRLFFLGLVALDGGRFDQAVSAAEAVMALDQELTADGLLLRSRSLYIAASVSAGQRVSLTVLAEHRRLARRCGAPVIESELSRRIQLDDVLAGHAVQLESNDNLAPVAQALDLQVRALAERRPELLLAAADVWRTLGTGVWEAQSLLWHAELTGVDDAVGLVVLARIDAPSDLAERLRAQLRGLRP